MTAARVVRERGGAVPLAEVAAEAGVGIGTLYRHFPDRDALLAALAVRAQDVVLEQARHAAVLADAGHTPREAVAAFLDAVVVRRVELVLPFRPRGAGRASIVGALEPVVRRGVTGGDLRADATAADVLLAAALLIPAECTADARRHVAIHLDGLARPVPGIAGG